MAVPASTPASSRKLRRTISGLEPHGAEHTDLLSPLDHRPGADHTERGHAHQQAESHEPHHQPLEREVPGDDFVERLLHRLGLHPVLQEELFEPVGRRPGVDARREPEVVGGGLHEIAEGSERRRRCRYPRHLEGNGVLEDRDDRELQLLARLRVADLHGDGLEGLVLGVEAGELEVRRDREAPVVSARNRQHVHHGQAAVVHQGVPDLLIGRVAPRPWPRTRSWSRSGTLGRAPQQVGAQSRSRSPPGAPRRVGMTGFRWPRSRPC